VGGGRFGRVVCEAGRDPAHVRGYAGDGDDVCHAVVVGCCAGFCEFGFVVCACVTGAADSTRCVAAARVCGFEEGQEGGGDADDGLGVDGEGAGPAVPACGHCVAELRDGLGFVDVLPVLGTEDAGVVDEDIDVASLLLDLCCGSFDGFKIGYVAGYSGEDGRGFRRGRRRFKGFDRILKDVEAATEDVDFCCAILVQRGSNREANSCYGK
jgi:hypothetical protein